MSDCVTLQALSENIVLGRVSPENAENVLVNPRSGKGSPPKPRDIKAKHVPSIPSRSTPLINCSRLYRLGQSWEREKNSLFLPLSEREGCLLSENNGFGCGFRGDLTSNRGIEVI